MKKLFALALVLGLAVGVTACGDGGKAAADTAIKAAEAAFDAAKAEAVKYVPDQATAVEGAIAAAKAAFAKGDFKGAAAAASELTAKIAALGDAAKAKKAELTTAWEGLSTGLPGVVGAITSRVDILSKSKKLPQGISQEAFDGAKSGLATINAAWAEANDAFKSGDVAGAMAKANTVKAKAAEIMGALNMPVPDALK
jgi:hypothetical protein